MYYTQPKPRKSASKSALRGFLFTILNSYPLCFRPFTTFLLASRRLTTLSVQFLPIYHPLFLHRWGLWLFHAQFSSHLSYFFFPQVGDHNVSPTVFPHLSSLFSPQVGDFTDLSIHLPLPIKPFLLPGRGLCNFDYHPPLPIKPTPFISRGLSAIQARNTPSCQQNSFISASSSSSVIWKLL